MRSFYLVLICTFYSASLTAEHVPLGRARETASAFYAMNASSGISDFRIKDYSVSVTNGVTTRYTFFFQSGGFVMVPGDDAAIPILGFSLEGGYSPSTAMSPATKGWLEGYDRQIEQMIRAGTSNRETLQRWQSILESRAPWMVHEIGPWLSSKWGQGCYYNDRCPVDVSGPCDHALTGCVATAMAQVLRFHRYPAEGVGSHTYFHEKYGTISADFGTTTYAWDSMPDHLDTLNWAVATLMSHAGISVNIHYGPSASGAYLENVTEAFSNFFNYNPEATYVEKDDLSDGAWKALLCDDLTNGLPVIYGGFMGSTGHAFVCDGFRSEDSLFHFNWGWNGSFDGWYAIGALFPGWSTAFNERNSAIFNLKPFQSQISIRITDPPSHSSVTAGDSVRIAASVIKGNPGINAIRLNGTELIRSQERDLEFLWKTSMDDIGVHRIQAVSFLGNDSVFTYITFTVTDWIIQATHFPGPREIHHISAPDSTVAWAVARYPDQPTSPCNDVIHTTDGGITWVSDTIGGCDGLVPSMIFGWDSRRAYIPMYRSHGNNTPGIFATFDGGASWLKQQPEAFSYQGSFPNCVHFFSETNGWCMGDPVDGEFEIYTTTDRGAHWTRVEGEDIPDPQSGEYGIIGYYSVVNDTVWFGTNRGRIFRSCDGGYTWSAFLIEAFDGKVVCPAFRTGSHGLTQCRYPDYAGEICESFDGGETWTPVETSGEIFPWDLFPVAGSKNTWISIGNMYDPGSSVSFDGGHSWTVFPGLDGTELFHGAWVNERNGWLGSTSYIPEKNGIYRYIGRLAPPVPPPSMLQATPQGCDISLIWEEPLPDTMGYKLLGYNIFRNGMRINATCLSGCSYFDCGLPTGEYTYCVRALYDVNESKPACIKTAITLQADEIIIGPNPVCQWLTITSGSLITGIRIYDLLGNRVALIAACSTQIDLDVSRFPPGCYLLVVSRAGGNKPVKIIVQ